MIIPVQDLKKVVDTNKLPKTPGLYFVYPKLNPDMQKPLYIGSATGKSGLHGRIHRQHLNALYTETRFSKTTTSDAFQVSCNKFNSQNKQYIDKSTLRKAIGRTHQISPGKDTADYIKSKLDFYVLNPINNLPFKDQATSLLNNIIPGIVQHRKQEDIVAVEMLKGSILAIETIMIKHYKPFYNTQNKA